MDLELGINKKECLICLEILEDSIPQIGCCQCQGKFHLKCLKLWISLNINDREYHSQCPLCRIDHRKCHKLLCEQRDLQRHLRLMNGCIPVRRNNQEDTNPSKLLICVLCMFFSISGSVILYHNFMDLL